MRLSECYLPLISATVMQPRKKKRINKIQYVMLSTTSQLNMFWIKQANTKAVVRFCIMGGCVWNYLCVKFKCGCFFFSSVLWYNKSFIAVWGLIFIALYLVLPPMSKKGCAMNRRGSGEGVGGGAKTWWMRLTMFSHSFERSFWVTGSKGVPDAATSPS